MVKILILFAASECETYKGACSVFLWKNFVDQKPEFDDGTFV